MQLTERMNAWGCLAVVLAGLAGCQSTAMDEGADYHDPARFEKAVAKYEKQDAKEMPPRGAVVGVGSSSMRMWAGDISKDLAPLTIIPRGFGGSNMNDLLHYVDRLVLVHQPRAVVIYEGDNDIAQGVSPVKITRTFERLVDVIHEALPKCRVYMLSIKPSPARWGMWPEMLRANRLLAEACEADSRLTYIDIAKPMLGGDGRPRAELYVKDRLHMTRAGYEVWRDAVRPVLVEAEKTHERAAE